MLTTQTTITPGLAHIHITGGGGVKSQVDFFVLDANNNIVASGTSNHSLCMR